MEIAYCPRCGTRVQSLQRFGRLRPVCPACHYVHFANPRVAVVVFVADGDRVLLVKRGAVPEKGKWALAAGFMDLGERPEEAAAREVREETGLEVEVLRLLEVGFDDASRAITILYQARLQGGELAASDDAQDARWFARDELPELGFESTRRMVRAWVEGTL